ncbi:hypothetical protein KR054_000163 [Drosophila jambulina]|nr:hypothetical protein KR054_000163 [Drosophila jambulina]
MSIALKLGSIGFVNRRIIGNKILTRNSHVYVMQKKINSSYKFAYIISRVSYRNAPPPHSKATRIGAVAVGATMWWWVLWHLWHEPDHITGEFDYPNPKIWSNSELGIPKDDV